MSRSLLSKELKKLGYRDLPVDTTADVVATTTMGREYVYVPEEGPYDEYQLYITVHQYTRTEAGVEAYLTRSRSGRYMKIVTTFLHHCDTERVLSELDRVKAAVEVSLLLTLAEEQS